MSDWVYIQSEPSLWTVGFYDPDGDWQPESDHSDKQKAAERVHYLNGGDTPPLAPSSQLSLPSVPDVDQLANFIRAVDGTHSLGAGVLAEHICQWLATHTAEQAEEIERLDKRCDREAEMRHRYERENQRLALRIAELEAAQVAYEELLNDKRRLTKELDRLIDSTASAEQPSLCDVVGFVALKVAEANGVSLIQQIEEAQGADKKDAERWRWFVEHNDGDLKGDLVRMMNEEVMSKSAIDSFADAALASTQADNNEPVENSANDKLSLDGAGGVTKRRNQISEE